MVHATVPAGPPGLPSMDMDGEVGQQLGRGHASWPTALSKKIPLSTRYSLIGEERERCHQLIMANENY
jgi:hypothetical protein